MNELTMLTRPVPQHEVRWPEDVAKLKAALNALGYDASDYDIEYAYECVSEEQCAGWLSLRCWDSMEGAAKALMNYIQPNPG